MCVKVGLISNFLRNDMGAPKCSKLVEMKLPTIFIESINI